MKVIGFKVWYSDGSVVKETDWVALPSDNLQVIMVYYDEQYTEGRHYRETIDGCDWYWFDGEKVHGVRSEEGIDVWSDKPEVEDELIKQGTMLDYDTFTSLVDNAMQDTSF